MNADGAIIEELGNLLQEVRGKRSLKNFEQRITELTEMITDLSSEARNFAESIDVDPQSLEEVQERRAVLQSIRRKYGETLQNVLDKQEDFLQQISDLENADTLSQ